MKLHKRVRLPNTFVPTHDTSGLPGFKAIDVFAPAGTLIMPPEAGKIVYKHYIEWDAAKRVGGWTCYLQARNGDTYFLTHFHNLRREGRVLPFQSLGRVAEVPGHQWEPHIHEGKHKGLYQP